MVLAVVKKNLKKKWVEIRKAAAYLVWNLKEAKRKEKTFLQFFLFILRVKQTSEYGSEVEIFLKSYKKQKI